MSHGSALGDVCDAFPSSSTSLNFCDIIKISYPYFSKVPWFLNINYIIIGSNISPSVKYRLPLQ